jgi:hypothetical protein
MTSGRFNDEAIPELVCQHTELRITGSTYAFFLDSEVTDSGEVIWGAAAVDLSATLHCQTGPNLGRRTECRFSTRGQLLRMVCAIPDQTRTDHPPQNYIALFTRRMSA